MPRTAIPGVVCRPLWITEALFGGTQGQDCFHNYTKKGAFFTALTFTLVVPKLWWVKELVLQQRTMQGHQATSQSLERIQFHLGMSLNTCFFNLDPCVHAFVMKQEVRIGYICCSLQCDAVWGKVHVRSYKLWAGLAVIFTDTVSLERMTNKLFRLGDQASIFFKMNNVSLSLWGK